MSESNEAKITRLCQAIYDIQDELAEVFAAQVEDETPVLEITPGGCNFVVGDNVVVDSSTPEVALQTIMSAEWSN